MSGKAVLLISLASCAAWLSTGCYRSHGLDGAADAAVRDDPPRRTAPDAGPDPDPEPPPPGARVVQLAAGMEHVCALTDEGDVYCWGSNQVGEAAAGRRHTQPTPNRVRGLPPIASIDAGRAHTCAVDHDDNLYCWGFSAYGQLGVPDGLIPDCDRAECSRVPLPVPDVGPVTRVFAGTHGTCATTPDARVRCWGRDRAIRATPRDELDGLRELDHGIAHGCAITSERVLRCFGESDFGLLGDEGRGDGIVDLPGVVDVEVGSDHACAIDDAQRVFCWGHNWAGAVGVPKEALPYCVHGDSGGRCAVGPVRPSGHPLATAISVGDARTCIIEPTGGVSCWGAWTVDRTIVQCGSRPDECDDAVAPVAGIEHAVHLVTGGGVACAVEESGEVLCWGWAGLGGLGDGRTTDEMVDLPVRVPGFGG